MRTPLERELPGIDNKESELIADMLAKGSDDARRLVYADWLEEQGDQIRAEYLRLECRVHAVVESGEPLSDELRAELVDVSCQIGMGWTALVTRVLLEGCHFKFHCPLRWEDLSTTKQLDIRFCRSCKREVHYCYTPGEAREQTLRGNCVAVDPMFRNQFKQELEETHEAESFVTMGIMIADDDEFPSDD